MESLNFTGMKTKVKTGSSNSPTSLKFENTRSITNKCQITCYVDYGNYANLVNNTVIDFKSESCFLSDANRSSLNKDSAL